MRASNGAEVFWAVMVTEFKIITREPGGLAILVIMPYLVAGGMAFMASFFTRISGSEFIRQFIGFEVLMVSMIMVQSGARFLNEERSGGRLEMLMVAPTSMYIILLATSMVMVIIDILAFLVASAPVIYASYGLMGLIRLIPAMIIVTLGLMPLYGIGLILAGVVIRIRDVDSLMNIVTPLLTILSGATYPIYVLPRWVDLVVGALPMYQLYGSLIGIITGGVQGGFLASLLASTVIYLLLGMLTYSRVERNVLKGGVR